MGTTRTRAWLLDGNEIIVHREEEFGARYSGQHGRPALCERLGGLCKSILDHPKHHDVREKPIFVIGAGMITSAQGIQELQHLPAPVGLADLAANVDVRPFPAHEDLQLLLVPGVSTLAPDFPDGRAVLVDVMRGEETLCIGLILQGRLRAGDILITMGSHWKWIWIDESLRICRSRTSLTGELIHVTQDETLLKNSLPRDRPKRLDDAWLRAGSECVKREGLSRTLFLIRLLDQGGQTGQDERLAFLYGAFVESEIEGIKRSNLLIESKRLLISGHEPVTRAFAHRLRALGCEVELLTEDERDRAFLKGLREISHYINFESKKL